jgi:toxin ParE1/3/4
MPAPRVVRNPQADDDLVEIAAYLWLEDAALAERFLRAAEAAFRRLARFPRAGSPYRSTMPTLARLRKCPIPGFRNHLIFYRPIEHGVQIIRVLHGARELELLLDGE